jgi:hypothetical protein
MSWQSFKDELKSYLDTPSSAKDIPQFAKVFTNAYDNTIKQGGDLINKISIQKGNKDLLEVFTTQALITGLTDTSGNFNLLNELGKGVIMYWTGATLNNYPIPPIPAPGSTTNVGITQNIVVNPGQWPNTPPLLPNTNSEIFLNSFVLSASTHLFQISGIITTISLYPPVGSPAPGFINWNGYII